MIKEKLIKLRCKAWGITEDEYYCNQCGDFSLEDMAKAYRRGKNQSREKIAELNAVVRNTKAIDESFALQTIQLTKAKNLLTKWVELYKPKLEGFSKTPIQVDTEQFLKEIVQPKV